MYIYIYKQIICKLILYMLELSKKYIQELSEKKLIVIWNGKILDLTEYQHIHPGGSEILQCNNGKDVTEVFEHIGHSKKAYHLLKKYIIGKIENYSENTISKSVSQKNRIMRKLFTKEDYLNIHKLFGLVALIHIVGMSILFFLPEKYCNTYKQKSRILRSIPSLIHSLLSLSSLQFIVPNISDGNIPAIHTMFRAHNICFALRGILCNLVIIWLEDKPVIMKSFQAIIVMSTLICADWISKKFKHKSDNYKTTASMPYWSNCSQQRQRYQKRFYAWAQFGATCICLDDIEYFPITTLLGIQGSALLMTLCRKQLITPYTYHNIYTIFLLYPIMISWKNQKFSNEKRTFENIYLTTITYILRSHKFNKYLIWGILCINKIISKTNNINMLFKHKQIANLTIFIILTIMLFNYKFQDIDNTKNDPNNRVLSIENISTNQYLLKIRTKNKINIYPGQHIIISKNGQQPRKYSPITFNNIENHTIITIAIKRYPHPPKRENMSTYITNLTAKDIVYLNGPVGCKYIDNNILITPEQNILLDNTKKLLMFSAGSGVTPIYSIAKKCQELGQDYQIIHSDRNRETAFISNYLHTLSNVSFHYTSELGRLSDNDIQNIIKQYNKEIIILTCGPDHFNEMISRNSKYSIIF